MDSTIQCDIVSFGKEIFSGPVSMIIASGINGDLGIAPRHAPLITILKPGPVRLVLPDGEETVFVIGGGMLEVMPHVVSVLADSATRATDMDEAAARRAQKDAERTIKTAKRRMEIAEAEAQLRMAIAELRELDRMRKKGQRSQAPKTL